MLLTLHAYGTWMPDRPEGSVHWRRAYQPQHDKLAREYRYKQREPIAHFDDREQRILINTLFATCPLKQIALHAVATDASHLHALLSWRDERDARLVQERIKISLTAALNNDVGHRTWFTRGGHRKRVFDRAHFDHLRDVYLPSHKGLCWDERRGYFSE